MRSNINAIMPDRIYALYRTALQMRGALPLLATLHCKIQRYRNLLCNRVCVALRPIGIELRAVIPSVAHCEPVDRAAAPARAQLFVQRFEIPPPPRTVVVAREPGPILVAVIMQVGSFAGLTVTPGRQDGARVNLKSGGFLEAGCPGPDIRKPCADEE